MRQPQYLGLWETEVLRETTKAAVCIGALLATTRPTLIGVPRAVLRSTEVDADDAASHGSSGTRGAGPRLG